MLGEFAAAVVVFANSLSGEYGPLDDGEVVVAYSWVKECVEGILQESYP